MADYNHTLTIGADITSSSFAQAINTNLFALDNILINSGVTVATPTSSGMIYFSPLTNYGSFENNGTITATGNGPAVLFDTASTITSIINQGTINSYKAAFKFNTSSVNTFTNSSAGVITSSNGIVIRNLLGTIATFSNAGTLQAATSQTIQNTGTIQTLSNTGSIISDNSIAIENSGLITELTNTGTISAGFGLSEIFNGGVITTLNNDQGRQMANPISFDGLLPTNYNIIINSTSDFGQIEFNAPAGSLSFGIHSSSTVEATTYSAVISGFTDPEYLGNVTSGTVTNNGSTYSWSLINSSATSWDLILTLLASSPSAADTQTSIRAIKGQLQGNLNSLTAGANFANMNTYDCNFFDSKGGCFSFGNRYTDLQSPSMQTNSFVATGGYKIDDHFRIAGFIDQNLNYNMASNIDVENKGPLMGLIGVWNQNANQLGWQVKVANAYQNKDATIKRSVTGTSEAGRGKTDIDSQSYVAELSYNYAATSSLLLRPYMALRYAVVKQDGYTETGVDNPLTYNSIRDRSKTALVGIKVKKQLSNKVVARGSVGLEHDFSHKTDNLEVTGVSGLTSESFSNKLDKTRPVASIGADYSIDQSQQLSATAFYQELPFSSTKARTLYVNYMLAF